MESTPKKNPDAAHHHFWQTSDLIWSLGLAVGFGVEWLVPLSFTPWLGRSITLVTGGAVLLAGLVVVVVSKIRLNRHKQPSAPGKPTTALVTTGIFRYSRNPLYLGGIIAFVGLGLLADDPWLLPMTAVMAVATHLVLIRPEEAYLERTFGEDFSRYRHSVRRWL